MPPTVGVFHPGTQHSWQTALAFQEGGTLRWLATSVFYDPRRWPYRIERFLPQPLAARVHREFSRRHSPALDLDKIRQFGFWEWLEAGARRLGHDRLWTAINRIGNRRFGQQVIDLTEREKVDVLWGYNTSSVEVFRWAKRRGLRCVLDQTIGHCASLNRAMAAEQAAHPDFFSAGFVPFSAAEIAQQDEEVALADTVVVGSDFCARTLIENGCPEGKIRIVPYGFDETLFPAERPARPPLAGRPVRFLFVGLVHPRKGIATLLEAFQHIPPERASLTLVGSLEIPDATFRRYAGRVRHVGSVPRREVVNFFQEADCFVFPSLFEGGGIVLYEAAAAGLGIIQSGQCGDGVRDGRNGMILKEVTIPMLVDALGSVIDDRERLMAWQEASWQMRSQRSWQHHREQVRSLASQW
jgi:glycosyltransferase involved in cell wall biosynthesis